MAEAILFLADGTSFRGRSLGTTGETTGEVVFNTSMTGYQEILTDPSYTGQIVTMTYPLIGNYGVNVEDVESDRVHVKGFVVKEFCRHHSNFRATQSLIEYLDENKIIAIEGIDTRALTRHVRQQGAMNAMISTVDFDEKRLARKLAAAPSMEGSDLVKGVIGKRPYFWTRTGVSFAAPDNEKTAAFRLAVIDCGIKYNILRIFYSLGCALYVFPATATAAQIQAVKPDGIFISNGPGDPAAVTYVVDTIRHFFGKIPVFGICLGHQIIGLALGGRTFKLKFGHHGANHPVNDTENDHVGITSQNHGFCVDLATIGADVECIAMNLNDQTLEGLRHKRMPIVSFQHHPEAAPGPHDAQYLFRYFIDLMKKHTMA